MIVRSKFMHEKHISAVEPEIREYAESQLDKLSVIFGNCKRIQKAFYLAPSFFVVCLSRFNSGDNLVTSCNTYLGEVAQKVFDKYSIANVTTKVDVPEKFLLAKLNEITDIIDPLQLREVETGTPS